MSENVIQASFAAGELSPSLFARVDFAKYRSGAARMRNFFVDYRSGASTRPGTEFIRPAAEGTTKIRLVRFQQSTTVTYILEFGNQYLRFISNGSSIVEPAFGISAVNKGNPTSIVFAGGPSYATGDMIFISGGNVPQLANRYFLVTPAGGTFQLRDSLTGQQVDSSLWSDYTSGASGQRVYTISTPYTQDELSLLKFSQKANTMNITHPNHPPYKLILTNATSWALTPATFGATIASPSVIQVNVSNPGAVFYKYAVTAVDANGQETPVGNVFQVTSADLRTVAGTNQIVWTPIAGAQFYNIYGSPPSYTGWAADIGGMGFIGTNSGTAATSFSDSNIAPDFSQAPPIHDVPFVNLFPQVSSYYQQRLCYANGGGNFVQTFWMSRTGTDYNFDISNPSQANDAITAELVSLEVNEIKSMVPMPSGLIMLTTKGAWQVSGGAGGVATQGGPITPQTATATPQAYVGASDVPPILINYDLIFVQAKGSIVRDLTYNIYANIYTGNDISILSSHLFYDHQILEWAYAEEPFKIVWAIREDGILLSLTLVKEQDMYGWAHHDTRGNFTSVASVTEGQFDATYFAVQRPNPVGGEPVLQIERLADRTFPFGAEDAWCVDAGVESLSNFPDATLIMAPISGGQIQLTMIGDSFTNDNIGDIVRAGGGRMEIISFTDPSTVVAKIIDPPTDLIPDDPEHRFKRQASGTWSMDTPFTTVYSLDHLEGQQVSCLADGGVVNSLVVHNGSVTLPSPVSKVIVGYGYQAQLQTMYLDLGQEINSVQGKRKKVGALTVRCKDSRALKAGRTFETVIPIKEQNRNTVMGVAIRLITGDERIVMDPLWDVPGQIALQVDDPLPSTVLGVVPEVVVGDSSK